MVALLLVLAVAVGGAVLAGRRKGRRREERRPVGRPGGTERPATLRRTPSQKREPRPAYGPGPPGLAAKIRSLFGVGQATEETWRGLEAALLRADVGPRAATAIVERVRRSYVAGMDPPDVVAGEIAAMLKGGSRWVPPAGSPGIVMVVGVNGTGKTTTIGKLAWLLTNQGRSVSLAASDTFRAAAGEQLGTWAARANAHLVSQTRGADPGAVAYDAVQAARARGSDILIVDTAGRLHTREPLMQELKKVKRVLEKAAGRVDEVLLVLDATTGQNGIAQARAFMEAVEVTGVVLAKMDGTARGGIVLAVQQELGVPVKLVGLGERPEDLVPFDPEGFARGLVA